MSAAVIISMIPFPRLDIKNDALDHSANLAPWFLLISKLMILVSGKIIELKQL